MAQSPINTGPTIYTPEPKSGKKAYGLHMGRMEHALRWRQELPYGDNAWKRSINLYRGHHWSDDHSFAWEEVTSDNPRDRITVNVTASHIEDTLPFLIRQRPEFVLRPRNGASIQSAPLSSEVLNYSWREQGVHKQTKMAVQDGLVIGHGIMKAGYNLLVDWDEAENVSSQGHINYQSFIRKDEPFAKRINPFKFVFDPTAEDQTLNTARWAAELIFKPRHDVINNKLYSQRLRNDLKSGKENFTLLPSFIKDTFNQTTGETHWSRMSDEEVDMQDLVVLFELWDRKFEKYYVFPYGVERPLIEENWKYPYLDGFPYVMWNFMPMNDLPYGPGIPMLLENQQIEKNRIRTTEFTNRRKHGTRKIAVHTNAIDDKELEKFMSEDDEVIMLNAPANQAIQVIESATLPSDNYQVDAIIDEDMRVLLGADALLQGGSLPSRTSAREIDARQGVIGLKMQERVARVDDFVFEVATQFWQHIQANMSTNRIVKIAGPEAAQSWVKVTPEDIKGEYDLEMHSTSKPEYDPLQEKQQRLSLLQMMIQQAPVMAQFGYAINVPEVLKWALESFDRVETDNFVTQIPPQPPAGGAGPGQEVSTAPGADPMAAGSQGPISGLAGAALGGLSNGQQA
jgi:hypothetical protein